MRIQLPVIPLVIAIILTGCQQKSPDQPETLDMMQVSSEVETLDLPDTTGAAVWSYLQEVEYRSNWSLWPDKGELYSGQEPHGMLLTSYLNDTALTALTTGAGSMPEGAILVKENYMPDSTLAAVTVMYKVKSFNPEHNDWFFSKHLRDGSVDKAPNGMVLQGRVPGCQSCHGAQKANDYVFTSALGK